MLARQGTKNQCHGSARIASCPPTKRVSRSKRRGIRSDPWRTDCAASCKTRCLAPDLLPEKAGVHLQNAWIALGLRLEQNVLKPERGASRERSSPIGSWIGAGNPRCLLSGHSNVHRPVDESLAPVIASWRSILRRGHVADSSRDGLSSGGVPQICGRKNLRREPLDRRRRRVLGRP